MHIVHLLDKFRDGNVHGGLSTVVSEETRQLVARGHRVTVVARRFSENAPLRDEVDGIDIRRFDSANPAETYLRVRGIVQRLLGKSDVDIIHSHLAAVDLAGVRFLRKPVPVVRSFHGDWPIEVWCEKEEADRSKIGFMKDRAKLFLLEPLERLSVRGAKKIHVLSTFSKEYVIRKFGRRAGDITIIPPGIDLQRFQPVEDKQALRRKLGLPPFAQIILFAGRLIAWKGPDRVIAAFAKVALRNPLAVLVIAGGGREEAELRVQAQTLGVEDRVHFVGFQREQLPQYYAAADVVIVASTREETFGMVTAEALACGTPVLGTPFGATAEILGAISFNLLLKGSRVDDIAERLEDFFNGEWRLPLTASLLRDSVISRFSWKAHSDQLVDFYHNLQ